MLMLLIGALATAQPAPPVTALDAERAFAAEAQSKGQWTAFRHWADPTAVMFTPQAVWAQQFLKDKPDPAHAPRWAPSDSYVSCDGRTAVNVGQWRGTGSPSSSGSFATIWMRQASGDWRWTVDGGAPAKVTALPGRARTVRASCANPAGAARAFAASTSATAALEAPPGDAGQGRSADGTIAYKWTVAPNGERHFTVRQWGGSAYRVVVDQRDRTAASPPAPKLRP